MRRHRESSARLFKSILGEETPLAEITPKMVKDARDILARLPKNHGKSARENRAPQEAADAADDHERDKMQALDEQYEFGNIDRKTYDLRKDQQRVDRISLTQVNNHLNRLSGLYKWARMNSLFKGENPAEGLRFSKSQTSRGNKGGNRISESPGKKTTYRNYSGPLSLRNRARIPETHCSGRP